MNIQLDFLNYCVKLAKNGESTVSPNPMVGSIIVYQNKIISEAWHEGFGFAHAERNAILQLNRENHKHLTESQLYVSLEPCNHHGKTPPCTQLIIDSGIKEVIVGKLDPNPRMQGKSIEFLKSNGIKVTGPFDDLEEINKSFCINQNKNRPYIILKWAQSSDFFISLEDQSTKITNIYSNQLVHKWRSSVDGILIGHNTYKIDHPRLTTRKWPGKSPMKYLLSSSLNQSTIDGFQVIHPTNCLEKSIQEIYTNDHIGRLLIEGGSQSLNSFIEEGLWDEARIITNRSLKLNKGHKAPILGGKKLIDYNLKNDNICVITKE